MPDLEADMPPEEFRRAAHQAVDWMADYLAGVGDFPVLPQVAPGALRAALPSSAPDQGQTIEDILSDFRSHIVPAITHWNHPRFFAYFAISGSGPGILGEMLAAALNVNGMLWKSSPAVTELEQVTLSWLRQWLGLPPEFFGIIYDTASISSLHAIAAAREQADPEARTRGGDGRLTLYTSEQSHSSIEKGAITLGIGQSNVRKVPVDEAFRMRPVALRAMLEADRAAGKHPFCVVATVGTTSTTSIDPAREILAIARDAGLWLHVDGAYGGAAAIVPEYRSVFDGVAEADSVVVNPHKWLFTPVDLSVLYTRKPEILRRAFALVPEYLRTTEDTNAPNFMDYGVQLGRRFRALKLWFVMRYFGRERMAALVAGHIRWARGLADLVESHPDFELSAPAPFSLVCFRYKGTDAQNRQLLDAINASGYAFLSHTVLNGRLVLRLAIGNIRTTWEDVRTTWERIAGLAEGLR